MSTRMRGLSFSKYGMTDFLNWVEAPVPEPAADQVLIKVHATSINAADRHTMNGFGRFSGYGWRKPNGKIFGSDIAGEIIRTGNSVTKFKVGDKVFGDLSDVGFGGFAEYVAAPEKAIERIPSGVSYEVAAATPLAAITAVDALVKAGIGPKKKVLIYGASGGVGTFALQIAKAYGAEVTTVTSLGKTEQCRALGADKAIDFKGERMNRDEKYDIILGVNGYNSIWKYKRKLTIDGTYIMIGGLGRQFLESFLLGPVISSVSTKRMRFVLAKSKPETLRLLAELLGSRKIKPVIDRIFSFNEATQAFKYIENGGINGKIVLKLD